MKTDPGWLEVRLAADERDVRAAQRLRYRVFVEELRGDGPLVDHNARLERDEFDPVVDHLLLVDTRRDPDAGEYVVGAYRLLRSQVAEEFGRYYCDSEYDLTPLRQSGRRLVELGRSCVDPAYRGGSGMFLLWNALADYVLAHDIEILFGVASFHGTDVDDLAAPLALLHHRHLAPPDLRVRALPAHFLDLGLQPESAIDKVAAMKAVPALIKAYLRLGGFIGEGGFVDHAFNTIDVCLVLDMARLNARQRAIYTRGIEA